MPIGIIGLTPSTLRLIDRFTRTGLIGSVSGIYTDRRALRAPSLAIPTYDLTDLRLHENALLVVAEDRLKEDLVRRALPHIPGLPRIVLGGHGHFAFQDETFEASLSEVPVPSLANGYPEVLIHLYQCLSNAARLGLAGVVAEFGMFKGGTTMILSRFIERLGQSWPVIGFDTFGGFPPRQSPLDMYDHPDCVYTDVEAARRYLAQQNVEVVVGDITSTVSRLANEAIVLSFVDTDNYTSAMAALEFVRERTVIGGSIVFDHFTGANRFRYTLGERMAGAQLLDDSRYFHLHGTGVFYRQL